MADSASVVFLPESARAGDPSAQNTVSNSYNDSEPLAALRPNLKKPNKRKRRLKINSSQSKKSTPPVMT